jgi:hypothetical protein
LFLAKTQEDSLVGRGHLRERLENRHGKGGDKKSNWKYDVKKECIFERILFGRGRAMRSETATVLCDAGWEDNATEGRIEFFAMAREPSNRDKGPCK